jgi:hypothetical protein
MPIIVPALTRPTRPSNSRAGESERGHEAWALRLHVDVAARQQAIEMFQAMGADVWLSQAQKLRFGSA